MQLDDVPIWCPNEVCIGADCEFGFRRDPKEIRFNLLQDVAEAPAHLLQLCPLLAVRTDVLTFAQADRTARGRLPTWLILDSARNANERVSHEDGPFRRGLTPNAVRSAEAMRAISSDGTST
jgi:hypothetical protein